MRILLVEDDRRLAKALSDALELRGYTVSHAPTWARAYELGDHDLVLLDLTLPDADGIEACAAFRSASDSPLIMLTARADTESLVQGLRNGADDYVTKPFRMAELDARIAAVLRRSRPRRSRPLRLPGMEIDSSSRRVMRDGESVHLTPTEYALLASLAQAPGAVVTRERLLIEVWQTVHRSQGRTLDVHMTRLRGKLPGLVETVRGSGYRLAVERCSGVS
ncbi:response regulator [Microbispora sp. CA-135349]|uniref:response regulator n=1 Tax=Microbispora sp. CA-135349 TaxID=3239953 RepID=UPI003D90B6AB